MEDYNEMECIFFFGSQFKHVRDLGRGGYGKVVLCENVVDKMEYAVKVIPMSEGETKEFLLESQTLAKVDHPNIGKYHISWMEEGTPECVKAFVQANYGNPASYHSMESRIAEDEDSEDVAGEDEDSEDVAGEDEDSEDVAGEDEDSEDVAGEDEDSEDVVGKNSKDVVGEVPEDLLDEKPVEQPCRTLFIAMKGYCSSIHHQIEDPDLPPLSSELVSRIFKGLVAALAHLQSLKIVHGDVKPENVLLDEAFNPKLIDFGSSFTVGESFRKEGGTEYYSKTDEYPTHALDVYGFGVTMLELICKVRTYGHRMKIWDEINGGIMPHDLVLANANDLIKGTLMEILNAASPQDRPDIDNLTSVGMTLMLE